MSLVQDWNNAEQALRFTVNRVPLYRVRTWVRGCVGVCRRTVCGLCGGGDLGLILFCLGWRILG